MVSDPSWKKTLCSHNWKKWKLGFLVPDTFLHRSVEKWGPSNSTYEGKYFYGYHFQFYGFSIFDLTLLPGKIGHHIFYNYVHIAQLSMRKCIYLSIHIYKLPKWKIRVSLSKPRSTRSSFLERNWSKHPVEALSLVSSILSISIWDSHFIKITNNTNIEDKVEGVENFQAWNYRVLLVLEEHDLEEYVKGEVVEAKGDEDKATHKKNLVKSKRIIYDSIKDHFIPHVSSLNTPT